MYTSGFANTGIYKTDKIRAKERYSPNQHNSTLNNPSISSSMCALQSKR